MASLGLLLAALDRWAAAVFQSPVELRYREVIRRDRDFRQIILGTSHAARGIHPGLLEAPGFRPFNFAFDAATATYYQHWYRLFRRYHTSPSVVLFSVDWVMVRESQGSRQFEHDSEYFPLDVFLSSFTTPGLSPDSLLSNRFPLIKERNNYQLKLFGQELWGQSDLTRYHEGYVPVWHKHPNLDPPKSFPPILPRQVQAMEALVGQLQQDGAQVVLIQPPEFQAPAAHDDDTAVYQTLARKFGLMFLDYNKALRSDLNDDRQSFSDWQHLSERGAERFSRRLRQDLIARGVMAAPRPVSQRTKK